MKKINLTNGSGTILSLSNVLDNRRCSGEEFLVELEKATTAQELAEIATKYSYYTWTVKSDDGNLVKISAYDNLGNQYWLRGYHEKLAYSSHQIQNCVNLLIVNGVDKSEAKKVLNDIVIELTGKDIYEGD